MRLALLIENSRSSGESYIHHFAIKSTTYMKTVNAAYKFAIDILNDNILGDTSRAQVKGHHREMTMWFRGEVLNFRNVLWYLAKEYPQSEAISQMSRMVVSGFNYDKLTSLGKEELTNLNQMFRVYGTMPAILRDLDFNEEAKRFDQIFHEYSDLREQYNALMSEARAAAKGGERRGRPTTTQVADRLSPTDVAFRGEQASRAELAVEDILSRLPERWAHHARMAIGKSDNKLTHLLQFIQKHGLQGDLERNA